VLCCGSVPLSPADGHWITALDDSEMLISQYMFIQSVYSINLNEWAECRCKCRYQRLQM